MMRGLERRKILAAIIDIFYPKRNFITHGIYKGEKIRLQSRVNENYCLKCGRLIKDAAKELCHECVSKQRYFDRGVSLSLYDGQMKKSILMFKDGFRFEYGRYYADELHKTHREFFNSISVDIIIPVPISKKKLRKRGYNQSEVIAARLGELLHREVKSDIVKKLSGKDQKTLNAENRKKNLKNAFILCDDIVQSKRILLVDDVFTTGSTIDTLAKLLKEKGAVEVYFCTVCTGSGDFYA